VERDRDLPGAQNAPTGAREQEGLTALFERELMVRSGLLEFATPAQIGQLVALVRDAVFLQGSVIYRRGEPADRVYILTDGRVELTAPSASAWRFGAGAGLGILDAVLVRPYARTATALSDVRCLEVKADDYFDFLQDNIELGESLVTTFAMALHKAVLALPEPEMLLRSSGKPLLAEDERGLSMVERLLLVRRMRPFQRASVQSLVSLAQHAREVRVHTGDVLFKEGDRSDVVWMVARGAVEIRRRNPSVRAARGAGDLVEHYAALCTGERQFTATATADSVLLQIDREELLDRMEEHFDLVRSILAFLAGEREKLNEALVADRRSLLLSRG
jgi:CRP-like cAMP-binding protein